MAYLTEPARTPQQARDNAYERPCYHCGGLVPAGSGTAFLIWNEHQQKNRWEAACHAHTSKSADDESCWELVLRGAEKLPPVTGSVAAKAVSEAKSAEEEMDRILEAPALVMPDADLMRQFIADSMGDQVEAIGQAAGRYFNDIVPGMIAETLASARPISITVGERPSVTVERSHKALPDVLLMVVAGTSPFLVGPAGSGKTTLAEQVAKCLSRPFYMASRVTSEYKLVGFVDAQGKTVRTQFREAYEHGGIFLFDEVDASDPDALTAFNAALAGQLADFPDGMVARHKDFAAIAAGNTFGRGADRQYVGRNQLDAATLDRFQTYEVDYDEQLEIQLAMNDDWTRYVQGVRKAIEAEKVRHVVSPRASIMGARLLAAGMERRMVEETCVWKGLDAAQRGRVTAKMLNMGVSLS